MYLVSLWGWGDLLVLSRGDSRLDSLRPSFPCWIAHCSNISASSSGIPISAVIYTYGAGTYLDFG